MTGDFIQVKITNVFKKSANLIIVTVKLVPKKYGTRSCPWPGSGGKDMPY